MWLVWHSVSSRPRDSSDTFVSSIVFKVLFMELSQDISSLPLALSLQFADAYLQYCGWLGILPFEGWLLFSKNLKWWWNENKDELVGLSIVLGLQGHALKSWHLFSVAGNWEISQEGSFHDLISSAQLIWNLSKIEFLKALQSMKYTVI